MFENRCFLLPAAWICIYILSSFPLSIYQFFGIPLLRSQIDWNYEALRASKFPLLGQKISSLQKFPPILDCWIAGFWRWAHRTFNQYILLVVLSLPIDKQHCLRILPLHYWFGCSDSPKLPISSKNAIFAICGHFWVWPLWATFRI